MSENVSINCENILLEGIHNKVSDKKAAIITHPHPLYGGNMHNPVVTTMEEAFIEKGFSTLRFNFRGTQNSSGMFDDGTGEQDDVRAVISFLNKKGYSEILLAGYSFGSRINAGVIDKGIDINDHIMVSPPVAFMKFDDIINLSNTGLIVTGENDDIAPPDMIKDYIEKWELNTDFQIIKACDHFYSGFFNDLKKVLAGYL